MMSISGLASNLYDWLAESDLCQKADVIFVLAGRESRKHFAVRLFQEGWAPTLLLSVGRFEIRRFSNLELPTSLDLLALASATEPRQRHYFVTFGSGAASARGIALSPFGTLREILAFSEWLRQNRGVRSVTIVSSGFHLKRVRMCCQRFLSDGTRLSFVAVPDEARYLREHWWQESKARKLILSEVLKVVIYKLLCLVTAARMRSAASLSRGRLGAELVRLV